MRPRRPRFRAEPQRATRSVAISGFAQKTGVSRQMPQTSLRASHISPIVTYAFEASTIGGIRFRSSCAASSFRRASADSTALESRRPRSCLHAPICCTLEGGVDLQDLERLLVLELVAVDPDDDPLLLLDLVLVAERGVRDLPLEEVLLDRRDDSTELPDPVEVLVRLGLERGSSGPRRSRTRRADRSCSRRRSRARSPAAYASARRTAFSVGSASASSKEFVCSDCVPPSTAAIASSAVRMMFTSGCCAVSETPAVCVWNRISHERGLLARRTVPCSSRAQIRRAARYFAISSKKSRCALKKKERRGAKSSTSSPRSDRRLDVREPVRQRERKLLRRGRPGLANVVAGDRDRMPERHLRASRTRSCR